MANETDLQRLEQALREADRRGDTKNATIFAQALVQAQQQMASGAHATSGSAGSDLSSLESPEFKRGKALPTPAQGGLLLADALAMGLPKKLMSPEGEQYVRGAMAGYKQQNPISGFALETAGSVAPAVIAGAAGMLRPVVSRIGAGALSTAGRAAATGAPEGALRSVGASESRDPGELAQEAVLGGALSAGLGGTTSLGAQGVSGIARNVRARTSTAGAASDAQRELAKALQRDAPYGSVFDQPFAASTMAGQGIARLEKLGPEARLVDVGGVNTRRLADVLASMPGRAPQAFAKAIRQRKAERGERLIEAADEALRTGGKTYNAMVDGLIAERSAAAEPFYKQLEGVSVQIDQDLYKLLQRAGREALSTSSRLARLAGDDQLAITSALKEARDAITNASIPGKPVPFNSLDHVKRALYDLESAYARQGKKTEAAAYGNVRRELTAKLDAMSPKDEAGVSIYAQARNAHAGPSQIIDAVEAGRSALSEKPPELSRLLADMTDSEQEGLRVGVLQALREKAGSKSGATQLLDFWQEKNTKDKLKLIFGNDFNKFKAALLREDVLKKLEQTGSGSQTFQRLLAAEDLGAQLAQDAGAVAAATKTGDLSTILGTVSRFTGKATLPESTRNQLAALLMQRGGDAQTTLKTLDEVMRNMARRRQIGAAAAGSVGAQQSRLTGQ